MKTHFPLTDVQRRVMALLEREMKAPLANILALSQTLTAGRVSRVAVREYASMTSFEACRMMRLLEEMAVLLQPGAVRNTYPPPSAESRARTIPKRARLQARHRPSSPRRA
jgi:hypothetical protein